MRLNGWQRFGIVISAMWALTAAGYIEKVYLKLADNLVQTMLSSCTASNPFHAEICSNQVQKWHSDGMQGAGTDAALFGLLPIPCAWLFVYALLGVTKWVKAGFKPVANSNKHSPGS